MDLKNSPIQTINFNTKEFFVKRDDLLHKDFSGNKARKFYYFLKNDFPNIKRVISYGSAQSNAMYSLSVLCKLKNWEFEYYTNHIASYLKQNPQGNYLCALKNSMKIYEKEIPQEFDNQTLFISEGGAISEASYGIELLANEINQWAEENDIKNLKVFLPSGTGTTALYLQKYLNFQVLTCSCVGDEIYLKKQFESLEKTSHPTILQRDKKYHFGKLYKEFYQIHKNIKQQTKIEFDLLYDSLGWLMLEKYANEHKDYQYLYIHQGGIIGNESMIKRYEHKYG